MGVGTRGAGSSRTYLNIYANRLTLEYSTREDLEKKLASLGFDENDIQERKKAKGKNEGQPVYFFHVDYVEGLITDVRIDTPDWGGEYLKIEITDVEEKFFINLGDVFGRYAKDFIRRMDNLDLRSEVTFKLWHMDGEKTDNGKSYSGVYIEQDGKKIEYALANTDLPAPVKKKVGRNIEWDYSEQKDALYQLLETFLATNFTSEVEAEVEVEQRPATKRNERKVEGKKQELLEDDLPF